MKEKELRLALVCYGGVSLAVYMHGVTKEILKLAKASKEFHAHPALAGRPSPAYAGGGDTEPVYHDLLREIGAELDLRVIVDIIAGSSAGGINGVLLARALAHDLALDGLTELWLDGADVTRLMAADGRATQWSKWFLKPFLGYAMKRLERLAPDAEIREKLSMFVRSRWFKPPFDGNTLMSMLLEAAERMGEPEDDRASLLPTGQALSLFVTVTDFYGYLQHIPAHDPAVIEEREHRHVLRFQYRRFPDGTVETDFDGGSIPGLVFAARATSSFPGAFPPVQIRHLDRLLARRGTQWRARTDFLERNFARYFRAGADPETATFIDGSVLNNKPFAVALEAVAGRPAYREVDRRLVYIDPDPERPHRGVSREPPGFFRTIKGALSDIPRNEPVRDELAAIERRNERARQLRAVIDAARPRVHRMVGEVVGGEPPEELTYEQIHGWREAANARAAAEAGFAYESYLRLKLTSVLDWLGHLVATACGYESDSPTQRAALAAVAAWAQGQGVVPERIELWGEGDAGAQPRWVDFLLRFDVSFRARRLRFVIRALNGLYERLGEPDFAGVEARDLDEVKVSLYAALDRLRVMETGDFLAVDEREEVAAAFVGPLQRGRPLNERAIDGVLDRLAARMDLESVNRQVDEIFALLVLNYLGPAARRELFVAYVGFAFWDVLTFPLVGWRDQDEFNQIKVDRISPEDAPLLRRLGVPTRLRGRELNHFGAFFSRADRENDYLLGRLHACDRLVDLVLDAAGRPAVDADALKRRAFRAVLATEKARLGADCQAVAKLEELLGLAEDGVEA
ncbi:MAG TPA: patatin-like protein [Azospirillaceae bacterium]|nr:patatin-like protein [Azospirillaceae bacterium]